MFTGCRREYHPEAQTSQKVTNKFAKEPPEKNNHIQLKQGWILRIQKFREGIDLWLLCANLLLNVLYHIYVRMKIRESRLQNGSFIYKMGISLTKQDFKLQKETLGLQTGLSDCYLPPFIIFRRSLAIQRNISERMINIMAAIVDIRLEKLKELGKSINGSQCIICWHVFPIIIKWLTAGAIQRMKMQNLRGHGSHTLETLIQR